MGLSSLASVSLVLQVRIEVVVILEEGLMEIALTLGSVLFIVIEVLLLLAVFSGLVVMIV